MSGATSFDDVAKGAESLLHEALHTKSERISRGLKRVYLKEDETETMINIPWRRQGNNVMTWTPSRTFDAFYVYSHLSVFRASLYEADNTDERRDAFRRVCFRADYLSLQLHRLTDEHVDDERREIVSWLDEIRVPAFDPTPQGRDLVTA